MKEFKYSIYLLAILVFSQISYSNNEKSEISEVINCQLYPANNIWNTPIDALPVHGNSAAYINTVGATKNLHPDFGAGLWNNAPIGIPYVIVPGNQPKVKVTFDYSDESDSTYYPIPVDPPIEGGNSSTGDRHILMLDKDNCILYELWSSYPNGDGTWKAGSGAIFDLNKNDLRPDTWTSADAAGLPILPGLVRYDDIAKGEINHAIRFTVPKTQRKYLWPARHYASSITDPAYPPMGLRIRLKSSFDISKYSAVNQIILKAMKKYGMILADNGSAWFFSGSPDSRWNDDDLNNLKLLKGSDFEAVDESSLQISPNSGEAKQTLATSISITKAPTQICQGGSAEIQFVANGSLNMGNNFTAYLSDQAGNFFNSTVIGYLTAVNSGNFTINIPKKTLPGSSYKIKIISSNPSLESNSQIMSIVALPLINISGKTIAAKNTNETYSAGTTDNIYEWQVANGSIIGSAIGSYVNILWGNTDKGTVYLLETTKTGCSDSTEINVNLTSNS